MKGMMEMKQLYHQTNQAWSCRAPWRRFFLHKCWRKKKWRIL